MSTERDLDVAAILDISKGKKGVTVHIRFSEDVMRLIERRATHEDRSAIGYIRHVVHRHLFGVVGTESLDEQE